ncbi:MAG TPA: putative lipid II flippase FtsW [Eubacteriales bacterium]|nr:putative lipid II flippase FtsW [Clostridia bacterium]HRV73590.1 putative lipid II flippase FtsW [Eubacteriales bacterium]
MESVTATKKKKFSLPKLQFKQRGRIDFLLLLSITVLCAIGLVMVFSASYYYAAHTQNDGFYYLKRQAGFMALGYVAMLLLSRMNFRVISKLDWVFIAVSIFLLVAVLLFGQVKNEGKRWLEVGGISLQPAEMAKFGMMFFMCSYMAKHQREMKSLKCCLVLLGIIGVLCGLVILQPNMSMAVIIGMSGVILMFLGGVDIKYLVVIGVLAIIAFVVLVQAADYRMDRMLTFRNPEQDPLGSGYQLIQSFYAIGSGGIFGKGLNNSYQKLLYMVYGESDFIYAIICEELGLIGGVTLILLYAFVVYRGMRVALRCRSRFGSLLAAGISITFGLQAFINIGVVTGLLPTTGQTLPLVSAGGTSLLVFCSAMGILLNISREIDPAVMPA